jgi:hypothetical protein
MGGVGIMKPLPKAPLTPEDGQIIDRWYYRGGKINPLWYIQWDADTRDAELMFAMCDVKARLRYPPGQIARWLVEGWMGIEKEGVTITAALKITK